MKHKTKIKHPLCFFIFMHLGILFIPATIMMHLDRVYKFPNYVNVIVGLTIGVGAMFMLVLFPKNFSKAMKNQEKIDVSKIKSSAYLDKEVILIQERRVVANFLLILGGVAIWIAWFIFLPIKQFNGLGFWIFRIISIVITVLGGIFSFVKVPKLLVYKKGKLHIKTKEECLIISPRELISYKRNPKFIKDKNAARKDLWCDVVLFIENDKEIILKKADCNIFFK